MGQVVMEDGQPIAIPVQVDLTCNGRLQRQTVTAPDGRFLLDLAAPRSEDWMDPELGGSSRGTTESAVRVAAPGGSARLDQIPSVGYGRVSLSGCELRLAPRAGFASSTIQLSNRNAFENPDVGMIVLRRLSNPGASTVSLSVLKAPTDAREAFEKASSHLEKAPPDLKNAEKELQKALKKFPEFSGAWDLLGRVQMLSERKSEGLNSFAHAAAYEPGFIPPLLALAQSAVQDGDWESAWRWTAKALELDEGHAQALYWKGLAGYHLRRFEEGVKVLSRLYAAGFGEEFPFGWLPLGVMHAQQGRIPEAADCFRSYLARMPEGEVPSSQRGELEAILAQWQSEGALPTP
jgi:tetratricopeptide (TPR) repeat protein